MKRILFFLCLLPSLAWGQKTINLDPSSLGSLNSLLALGQDIVWVASGNTTGIETGTFIYPYSTIQEGLTAASAGNVVIVLDGTYSEHLAMATDSVRLTTLEGQNVEVQLLQTTNVGLLITGSGVTIGGGPGMGFYFYGDGGRMIEMAAGEADVTISYNVIDITQGTTSIGVNVGAAGATRLKLLHNKFIGGSGDGAFYADKGLADFEIIGNEFIGAATASGYAVQMASFNNGVVKDNYIHGDNALVADGFASGIFPHTATTGSTSSDSLWIINNVIRNCANGIRLGHTSQTADLKAIFISGNILEDCTDGIEIANDAQVYPATYDIYDNVFSGNTNDVNQAHATAANYGVNSFDGYLGIGTINATTDILLNNGATLNNIRSGNLTVTEDSLALVGVLSFPTGIASTILIPDASQGADVGSSALRFNKVFTDTLDANTGIVNTRLRPDATEGADLGLSGGIFNKTFTDTLDVNTGIINTRIRPDADQGADVGLAAGRFNKIFTDTIDLNTGLINTLIKPDVTQGADVGASGAIFNLIYGDTSIVNVSKINTNVIPDVAEGADLGASATRFNKVFSDTADANTLLINTLIKPDADDGANIGEAATSINLIYADSVHANWFGGSDFKLGGTNDKLTFAGDSIVASSAVITVSKVIATDLTVSDSLALETVVPLQADTVPQFTFHIGNGFDTDTNKLSTSAIYFCDNSFTKGSDSTIITELRAVMIAGNTPLGTDTLAIQVYWNDTINVTGAGATLLNAASLAITSITTGTVDASFANNTIPPNVYVFLKIPGVVTGRKPEGLIVVLSGYKRNLSY